MSEINYRICDLCKKKIDDDSRWEFQTIHYGARFRCYRYDVCIDCVGPLENKPVLTPSFLERLRQKIRGNNANYP